MLMSPSKQNQPTRRDQSNFKHQFTSNIAFNEKSLPGAQDWKARKPVSVEKMTSNYFLFRNFETC